MGRGEAVRGSRGEPRRSLVAALAHLVVLAGALAATAEEAATRAGEHRALREARAGRLEPERPNPVERLLARLEARLLGESATARQFDLPERGFAVRPGSIGPSSGPALGLDWIARRALGGALDLGAGAAGSIHGYQAHRAFVASEGLLGRRLRLHAEAGYRQWTQVRFHGLGGDSREDDETRFLYEDTTYGVTAELRAGGGLTVGARGSWLDPNAGPGRRSGPSIEEVFDVSRAPGLDEREPDFRVAELWVELDRRDAGYARSGFLARGHLARYDGAGGERFDFRRASLELLGYASFSNGYHTLASRLIASRDEANERGGAVPFYLSRTLGGPDDLRGFHTSRFRGDRLAALSLEYRWRLFAPADLALFVDAGTVDGGRARVGRGIGFRLHTRERVLLRVDLGFSSEDTVLHIRLGHTF